ncbi:tannase-domain-containing protein [Acephala macrosclerotiorum]|nr:tannase-domain-containing protein [Acephala macrosclerotiorum]
MRRSIAALAATSSSVASAANATLASVCTASYAKAALPADDSILGITIDASSVSAAPSYNHSVSGETFYPDAAFDYCNVTFSYSHNGRDDKVNLEYWLPSPSAYQNCYLATGGFAYAINGGVSNLAGGVSYGAVSGMTDGGFGSFATEFDTVFLLENGTINWEAVYMFGYQAIGEQTMIGKAFTSDFFNTGEKVKLRDMDGIIAGSPAFRYGQQQTNHPYSNVVEQTLDYYPTACALELIVNKTISNCDALDGKSDGVVARTDLCMLNYNITSTIGLPYSCAASGSTGIGLSYGKHKRQSGSSSTTPPVLSRTGIDSTLSPALRIVLLIASNRMVLSRRLISRL